MGTFHRDKALVELEKVLLNNTGNLTALQTIRAPIWVGSPEIRGTTTILWSCIITLVACIYTALHLNVPANTQKMSMLGEKLKWVLIGLIAPEVVLYLASSQFLDARRLSKELTSLWQQKKLVEGIEMEIQGMDEPKEADVSRGRAALKTNLTSARKIRFSISSMGFSLSWAG